MSETRTPAELPPFPGKPIRDLPIPNGLVWKDDEFGNAVLTEYNDRVRLDFDENPFLKAFKMAGGVVHGSNPFGVVLLDMIVRPHLRVATLPDLQVILDARGKAADLPQIRGGYKDAAFALRSVKEPNSYLAERLGEQLDTKMPWPAVIYLSGLQLVKDSESPCGLTFKFTFYTHAFHAPILSESSDHFYNAKVDRTTGLPTELGGTGRYFYSTEEGLSRIYLGRGSSIDTIWDELSNSQADGRVVFVDNSLPPERVAEYLKRLDHAGRLLQY
ncbi:MAG: hypothetical protein AMK73_03510 [Planctomycetes bacterium SM23_32]|nr:MAG: hypothetical protein AMK73_03510 [Planctomycetes bacterium SM23_32]